MAENQDWEKWVAQFNSPQPGAVTPGAAVLPAGPGTDVLSGANRANIATLFDPQFGRGEVQMNAAENAIAGGWGSGGFAGNQGIRLLDSERKANFELGAQLLEPYLQRESAASLQASDQAARLNQIAAEGAQALQRLQLSEAGQGARLSAELASQLQRQVIDGQQAMQQLTLREAGETGRQNSQIQGSLANTLLSAALAGKGTSTSTKGGEGGRPGAGVNIPSALVGSTPSGQSIYDDNILRQQKEFFTQTGQYSYLRPNTGGGATLGLGSSSIDQLLRKYGLLN